MTGFIVKNFVKIL